MAEFDGLVPAISDSGDDAVVADLLALLAASKVRLFKDGLAPGPHNVRADFVAAEATFTGYAAAVPTYSALAVDAAGNAVGVSSRMFFQATDAVNPNLIAGAWQETAAGALLWYWIFPAPVPLLLALKFLALVLTVRYRGPMSLEVEY